MINIMQGDCLELLKTLPDQSVDMVLADLPYGTTGVACQQSNRKFIGMERDPVFFSIAKERLGV